MLKYYIYKFINNIVFYKMKVKIISHKLNRVNLIKEYLFFNLENDA
jgi:hypothetical protein